MALFSVSSFVQGFNCSAILLLAVEDYYGMQCKSYYTRHRYNIHHHIQLRGVLLLETEAEEDGDDDEQCLVKQHRFDLIITIIDHVICQLCVCVFEDNNGTASESVYHSALREQGLIKHKLKNFRQSKFNKEWTRRDTESKNRLTVT